MISEINVRVLPVKLLDVSSHSAEEQYLDVVRELLEIAESQGITPDRTGTGRIRVFGRSIRADLSDGTLPINTTRKTIYEHGIQELLWMIKGSSNINDLADNTKVIWKDWAIEEKHIDAFIEKFFSTADDDAKAHLKKIMIEKHLGSIGPMYGHFWRNQETLAETTLLPYDSLLLEDVPSDKFKIYNEEYDELVFFEKQSKLALSQTDETSGLISRETYVKTKYFESNDQLGEIIRGIKRKPFSARHVMSSWIPSALPFESVYSPHENVLLGRGALAPCHILSNFFVEKANDGGSNYLNLHQTQRSCDWLLGVNTNIIFYSLLLHLVAHCTNLRPKILLWNGVDCHLYANHLEGAREQVKRTPYPPPKIKINPDVRDLFAIKREDIEIDNYQHHPAIRYPVSV